MIKAARDKQDRQRRKEQRSKPPLKQPLKCEVYPSPGQVIKPIDLRVE